MEGSNFSAGRLSRNAKSTNRGGGQALASIAGRDGKAKIAEPEWAGLAVVPLYFGARQWCRSKAAEHELFVGTMAVARSLAL